MSFWRPFTRGLRALINRPAADRDITDEVAHYLEEAAAALEATGVSAEDARRRAHIELGSTTVVREQVRGYGWDHLVDTLMADMRFSARRLRHSPLFTTLGALTLALGIGASTAIFSAVNPVLFQPLPYRDAGRLMMIWDGQNGMRTAVTFGTYRELLARNRSFESMAAMRPLQVTLTSESDPERLDGQYVSATYFRVLGVTPTLGRDFQDAEDQPNRPFVVIISDRLWRRRFGGDPAIVGRQISLADNPVTVIGVLPNGFENVVSPSADIWSPLQYDQSLPSNGREWGHHLQLVSRVRAGVHPDRAREELATIARTPLSEFPRLPVASLTGGFIANPLQDELTRSVRPALMAIVGAVMLLLIIACVNVTNLLLARGAERSTELAVRAALGASRSRLIRQLLTDALMLAILGGALGIALAYAAVDVVVALSPPDLPRAASIGVDRWALAFALTLTTIVGLAVGVFPALQGSAADFRRSALRQSMRIANGQRVTRRTLVVVQVALAVVLLVGAGLLLRSLQHLLAVPSGFNPSQLLTMQVQTASRRFRNRDVASQFFTQVLDAVQQVPGVTAAAFTSQLPLTGDEDVWGVHFESIPAAAANEFHDGYRYAVSPGYFKTMGIPLKAGRVLQPQDVEGAPLAAVINESFARRRLPGLNPIGQRLQIGPRTDPWFTVVGVVGDVKQISLAIDRADGVYVTSSQWARFSDSARWIVIRAQRDAAALAPSIRRAIWSVDKGQPIVRVATMDERVRTSAAERQFALLLFEAFGVVALILAAIGTYSLISGSVTERTREIGVRAALGASRGDILAMVLRQGMILVGFGIAIGLAGATLASGSLATLLFGVSRLDSATYVGVVTLLAGVSVMACAVPALRAARIRPSIALRSQ